MTDRELLELLLQEVQSIKADQQSMNNRLDVLETKIDTLETKIDTLETKVDTLEMKVDTLEMKTTKTQMLVEHEVIPHIQALAENHADLSRDVGIAKNVDERVGILEFDVKLIKKTLNSYTV